MRDLEVQEEEETLAVAVAAVVLEGVVWLVPVVWVALEVVTSTIQQQQLHSWQVGSTQRLLLDLAQEEWATLVPVLGSMAWVLVGLVLVSLALEGLALVDLVEEVVVEVAAVVVLEEQVDMVPQEVVVMAEVLLLGVVFPIITPVVMTKIVIVSFQVTEWET